MRSAVDMTDAGFFRGTSADQDNRFANKQKKLLKELNFSPILNSKLNTSKVDIDSLKPWIDDKIKEVLEKDDEILSQSIYEHLAEKEPDGKNILMLITGFVDESKASKFMEELWTKLIDLQENSNGLSKANTNDDIDSELKLKEKLGDGTTKSDKLNDSDGKSHDETDKEPKDGHRSSGSSGSATPPSRSISKSPGNHQLDEKSRGRPRRRLHDDISKDGSKSPENKRTSRSRSRSKTGSRSRSRSASGSKRSNSKEEGVAGESKRKKKSSPRSGDGGSRSTSRSYSRSRSRSPMSRSGSRSRSSTRSPRRRSRSPYGHSYRGRRSSSRSRGYRPRSRTPTRFRRIYPVRGSYRGSYGGFQDRRRGPIGPPRRRPSSPWGRRRFSPVSPLRRRRSPSFSPRRRRSPSPYSRRPMRSRSPPAHMMNRNIGPLRHNIPGVGGGHPDMIGSRHVPHHDMHRAMVPMGARSPRAPVDHRGFGDALVAPRHSPPSLLMSKQHDLPPTSHGLIPNKPGPSGPGLHSPPSSGHKKHKREKKHRKHKKSKKHRSPSPEKRKKHKKHKKTKKHKSH